MESLIKALQAYVGKAITLLSEARQRFGQERGFVAALVHHSIDGEGHVSEGATWLLKDILSGGEGLSRADTDALLERIAQITAWQAQLHICQCVQYFEISNAHGAALLAWLMPLLDDKRPFLRAWSMDALQHLACQDARLKAQGRAALAKAADDEAASVCARARKWA